MKHLRLVILALLSLMAIGQLTHAQDQLAATLEVLAPGVAVQRVNTSNPIAVEIASVVGVGDIIRTDETGEARITFFADGTDTTILPNSEYRIVEFQEEGDDEFTLMVEVIIGETTQRLNRVLGAASTYDVQTPGMTLAARGTDFAIRVEANGRSAMLVSEGTVNAEAEANSANVPAEFGLRSEENGPLSDVVRASTFDQLDAALDGCTASITAIDDVSLNVRVGPSLEAERIATIDPQAIDLFIGIDASASWYRIEFENRFGWVLSSSATINEGCAGLRVFEDEWREPTEETAESES